MNKIIYISFSFLIFFSCSTEKKENNVPKSTKITPPDNITITKENYTEGEILVVIDTAYWNGAIGDSIRQIFTKPIYGLPQEEPHFKVRRVDPYLFKGALQKFNNILIVANINSNTISAKYMNGLLGTKNVEKAKSKDTNKLPFYINSDVYAKGQNLMYIVAQSDNELKEKLSKNKERMLKYFDLNVAKQLENRYYYGYFNNILTQKVKTKFNIDFHIPRGYQFAKETEGFLWVRFPENDKDKNIVISELNYTSEKQFSDEYIAQWRDSLGLNLIKEEGDTNYYMMTQDYMPLLGEVLIENGNYAKLCRGLWKLKDNSLGGPFVSYVILNKAHTKIYYIESFVAAPGVDKRKLIRELRAVITSCKG